MSDKELLESILDVSLYDFLPKRYHTKAAIPDKIVDKSIKKAKKKRLELIKQHREAYAIEARIDERQMLSFHRAYGRDYQATLETLEEANDDRIAELKAQQEEK